MHAESHNQSFLRFLHPVYSYLPLRFFLRPVCTQLVENCVAIYLDAKIAISSISFVTPFCEAHSI